jgi:hypothetical protein
MYPGNYSTLCLSGGRIRVPGLLVFWTEIPELSMMFPRYYFPECNLMIILVEYVSDPGISATSLRVVGVVGRAKEAKTGFGPPSVGGDSSRDPVMMEET